jgi:DNA-binding transcriptional LysR family regulator
MLNWDDLRVFGAVSRSASLAAAGQQLGMDASTVGRRVQRLESQLKATLVVRSPNGLQLTQAGLELRAVALKVEQAMNAAGRAPGSGPISGVVRVSLPDALGGVLFVRRLLDQAARYPDLTLELAEKGCETDVAHGAADIAVSVARPQNAAGVVEALGQFEVGLYASAEYLAVSRRPEAVADLAALRYIPCIEGPGFEADAVEQAIAEGLRSGFSTTSLALHQQMIKDGAGFGFLPVAMGEASSLERLLADRVCARRHLWITTGRELAETARCRAVRAWLREAVGTTDGRPSSVVPFASLASSDAPLKARRTA